MSQPQLYFTLTSKSLINVIEFYKEKHFSIIVGNETINVSKELSILLSMPMYQHFQTKNEPYPIHISQVADPLIVECLKKYFSLAEEAKAMEVEENDAPILKLIGKTLKNNGIRRQIDAISFSQKHTAIHWASEFLSDFGFLSNFEEFSFDVCGEKFECPMILARLLSKKVSMQTLSDSSASSFSLKLEEGRDRQEYINAFDLIFELLSGHPLIVTRENREIIRDVALQIGCEELLSEIDVFEWDLPPISISNVYDRLRSLRIGTDEKQFSEAIEFSAKNFYALKFDRLLSIPSVIIEKILSNDQLRIDSESQLFDFARSFLERNGENGFGVLSKLKLEFLEPKEIVEFINKVDLNSINSEMWAAICNRLKCEVDIDGIFGDKRRWRTGRKTEISAIRNENKSLLETNSKLSDEVRALNEKNDKIQNESQMLKEEIKKLQNEVQTLKEQNTKNGRDYQILLQAISKMQNGLSLISQELIYNDDTIIGLKTKDYAGEVVIPEGFSTISGNAFRDAKLSSIKLPNSLVEIGENSFFRCSSLTSIAIPPNVTQIGECAFKECFSLSSVLFPPSVTQIGQGAFLNCPSLKSVTVPQNCRICEKSNLNSFDIRTKIIRTFRWPEIGN